MDNNIFNESVSSELLNALLTDNTCADNNSEIQVVFIDTLCTNNNTNIELNTNDTANAAVANSCENEVFADNTVDKYDVDYMADEDDIDYTANEDDVDQNSILSDTNHDIENTSSVANNAVSSRKLAKQLRNEGKSYISKSGKLISARVLRKLEACRKNCASKISYDQQKEIHKAYWTHGSYRLRRAAVAALIELQTTKTIKRFKSAVNPRRRDYSYNYFLEVNTEKISVCQKCFRFTLCESEQFIKSVVKAKIEGTGFTDMRGRHKNARKLSSNKQNEIIEFINSFPSYESHYSRRDTSLRYLPSDLSVAAMHRLYCEKYDHSVALTTFSRLFNQMGLKFSFFLCF